MKPFRLAIPAAVAALAAGCTSYDPQPLGELRLDAYAPSAGDAEAPASTPDSAKRPPAPSWRPRRPPIRTPALRAG